MDQGFSIWRCPNRFGDGYNGTRILGFRDEILELTPASYFGEIIGLLSSAMF